jgi:hypothetical protein
MIVARVLALPVKQADVVPLPDDVDPGCEGLDGLHTSMEAQIVLLV